MKISKLINLFSSGILILFFLLGCQTRPATIETPSSTYSNKAVGIRISFPQDWIIYTDKESAHESLKNLFPDRKRHNDSPLFIGTEETRIVLCHCLVDRTGMDILEYFELLYEMYETRFNVKEVSIDIENQTIYWVYENRIGELKFTYYEVITPTKGYIIRFSISSFSSTIELYRDTFINLVPQFEFLSERNRWYYKWGSLFTNLETQGLEFVKIDPPQETEVEENPCAGRESYLFWEAEGKVNKVYLMGSVHVGKPDFYPFPEFIEASFRDSENLVVELDIETIRRSEVNKSDNNTSPLLPEGRELKDSVSPSIYKEFEEIFYKFGLPIFNYTHYEPVYIINLLVQYQMMNLGYLPQFGVESYFLERARGKKKVLELETVDEQAGLLSDIHKNTDLADSLRKLKTFNEEIKLLMNAWQCGDIDVMEEMIFEQVGTDIIIEDHSDIRDKIFKDRNEKMVEKIEGYLQESENYFVVVGAGHLIGDDGIVLLLENKGFQVSRLSSDI
jgi:uncharacterized protein YbaP (TraB family)